MCEYKTQRQSNLQRHKEKMHATEDSETELNELASDASMIESEAGTDESDDRSDTDDPWEPLVRKTFQLHNKEYEELVEELVSKGYDRTEAEALASYKMKPTYRQELGNIYLNMVAEQKEMAQDSVHRKIKATARRLRDEEEYEPMEAWKYAVDKRKYLLDEVLEGFNPPTDDENEDD